MMKSMKLIALLALASKLTLSATTEITAVLDVIDPSADVTINVSSSSMAFGDQLITAGSIQSPTDVTVTLEGIKAATLTVPKTVELASAEGSKINLTTALKNNSEGAITDIGENNQLAVTLVSGVPVTADLGGTLVLTGTEIGGLYRGTITLNAAYN